MGGKLQNELVDMYKNSSNVAQGPTSLEENEST
jgi:hypothetical protein